MCSRCSTTPTSRDPSRRTAPGARNRWICMLLWRRLEARSGGSTFLGTIRIMSGAVHGTARILCSIAPSLWRVRVCV